MWVAMIVMVLLSSILIAWWVVYVRRRRARQDYIAEYPFTTDVESALVERYRHLGKSQVERILTGLRTYIRLSEIAGTRTLAMPSQAVDVAWHAFILNTPAYAEFCHRALGRFLHHIPAEAMESPTQAQDSIKRTWNLACVEEEIDPMAPDALPDLFRIDQELQIDDGFVYTLDCEAAGEKRFCATHIKCGGGCFGSPVVDVV